jgi:hypothetical protein
MGKKKIKAVVYIPPDTYAELEKKAQKLGTSLATVILEIIAKSKI